MNRGVGLIRVAVAFCIAFAATALSRADDEAAAGHAPVVSELKIVETSARPAQVRFTFRVTDADGDLDLMSGSPINAGVWCDAAGFAGNSFGKAERFDAETGVAEARASYAPNVGTGECKFTLTVKDKAEHESETAKATVKFD